MNLPEQIASFEAQRPNDVSAMVERINKAVFDRATFERKKSPHGSHILLRQVANYFADSRSMASFLCVLNADPDLMFNRVRKDGTRANLKGLVKVRKLFEFITGRNGNFETVSKALFAATIIAALKGVKWIASPEQEFILSSERVNSLPMGIRTAIYDYQHKHMTLEGDSRPQSCAFRTTFANLGIYHYAREEFANSDYTLGIMVDLSSPIVTYLVELWELNRY